MEGSQISLPRSYTLPREFKYHHPNNTARDRERRIGSNKVTSSRFYLPSTNSSDGAFLYVIIILFDKIVHVILITCSSGDVDSADNEEETDSEVHYRMKNNHGPINHDETQQHYSYEDNNKNEFISSNSDSTAAVVISGNSYLNNSQGLLRPNQLFRNRVKHETKL